MSYFSNFSTILYDPAGDGSGKLCTDILSRVRVRTNMKKEIVMMDKYDIPNKTDIGDVSKDLTE